MRGILPFPKRCYFNIVRIINGFVSDRIIEIPVMIWLSIGEEDNCFIANSIFINFVNNVFC